MKTSVENSKLLYIAQAVLFVIIALIDQALKRWALGLDAPLELSWVHFFPYSNSGVIGGYLSDLNPWIVRIFFSVLFGFLCLGTFLLLHFLQHKRVPMLKWGLVIYLSGVLGNVWDRMTTGKIIDYLIFQFLELDELAFNFADVVVVIGFVLVAIAVFREADALWFEKNKRQGLWIAPVFQRNFGLTVSLVGFAHFLVIALYSFTFLKVFLSDGGVLSASEASRIIQNYLVGLFIIEGGGLLLTFGVSVLFSHRMIGPLVALEQYLKRLAEKKNPAAPFRLRNSDYFRGPLESIAQLAATLSSRPSASADDEAKGESGQNPLE